MRERLEIVESPGTYVTEQDMTTPEIPSLVK